MGHEEQVDHLPLFKSPLLPRTQIETAHPSPSNHSIENEQEPKGLAREPTHLELADNDHTLHENPAFHRHTEATNAELFYDLFFVANLTVFTTIHEVNDGKTLSQYVGFFALLWFTWYQVSLYDVRFSMDSMAERVCKALQFGVMIGFAIVGPNFNVGSEDTDEGGPAFSSFKTLSIILMVSRLVLVFQYLQSLWFTRHYISTRVPMACIAATEFVAAFIYLGLAFTFHPGSTNSYIAWYIVAIVETLICTTISSVWRIISFKGTHLVQRMSLLTLIILGEGVMGLAETCQMIVNAQLFGFTPSTIGDIICSVLILYFIYMLYFDWLQEEHMGTIRQQIWAFLHFPLHLCLVLGVEGVSQFIKWRAATEYVNGLLNQYTSWALYLGFYYSNTNSNNVTVADWQGAANFMNNTAQTILDTGYANIKSAEGVVSLYETSTVIDETIQKIANGFHNADLAANATVLLYNTLTVSTYGIIDIAPAESASSDDSTVPNPSDSDGTASLNAIGDVFTLVYVYFFLAIGLVLILTGMIAWLSKPRKTTADRIKLSANFLVGVALCLLVAMDPSTVDGGMDFPNFIFSPWILPTVMMSLGIVVITNNVKLPFGNSPTGPHTSRTTQIALFGHRLLPGNHAPASSSRSSSARDLSLFGHRLLPGGRRMS